MLPVLPEWFWIIVGCLRWIRAKRGKSWRCQKRSLKVWKERPIPSRFTPKFPCCDRRDSLWAVLPLLCTQLHPQTHPLTLWGTLPKVELKSTSYCRHGILHTHPPNCWLAFKGHHHHPPQHHLPGTGLSPISPRPSSESTQWVESGLWWEGPEAGAFKERQRAKGG